MVREMKRALEALKSGDSQGYRKLFDATYDEVYCRSLLIVQEEKTAVELVRSFFGELFGKLDEADDAENKEKWLWQKYYEHIKKKYHGLLAEQKKAAQPSGSIKTLAEIPVKLPLLHRIMLTMYYKDDFTANEISGIFRLEEGKVREELDKLEKLLPVLTKDQPESVSAYLGSWKVLLLGASSQILSTGSDDWADEAYAKAAAASGIASGTAQKKKDDFEYFVADVELSDIEGRRTKAADLEEEPDEDDDDIMYDREDTEYDDDNADKDDEEDDDDDEAEDEDDDRYDWDLEDDGKKMVILGIVLALIIVAVIGFAAVKFLGKDDGDSNVSTQTEENTDEDSSGELIIRGEDSDEESGDSQDAAENEESEEEPQEEPQEEETEEEPAEPETLKMQVSASSVNVRSEPNTDCDVLTTVKSGEQVEVLGDPAEEWVQIRCIEQNSQEGYVKSEFLTSIE